MTLERLGLLGGAVVLAGSLLLIGALVAVRTRKDRFERRRQHLRTPVWRVILELTMGEGDEVLAAREQLRTASEPTKLAVLADAFALVPKLRGSARDHLRDLLREWGSVDTSLDLATSWSAVRRCRGIYRLGVLGEPSTRAAVLAGLADRHFAVRRTSMLALGSFPDTDVVGWLMDAAALEPRLRRDLLASVDRIGLLAVPVLREQLAVPPSHEGDRRGSLAAEALGLVGGIAAGPELVQALGRDIDDQFSISCLDALGRLGSRHGKGAAVEQLSHASDQVRRAAARALGMLGGASSVEHLVPLMDDSNVEVARQAAQSLRRCGPAGAWALAASAAPVAAEVRALDALVAS